MFILAGKLCSFGVTGGHYLAYCRHHVTGKWYEFDDRDVTEISEEDVLKQQVREEGQLERMRQTY